MTASLARVERVALRAVGEPVDADNSTPEITDLVLPNIADFIISPDYLAVEKIYPRQLLVLKLIMAEIDLLTRYDYEVLEKWTAGFTVSDDGTRYEGGYGTTPDVLERIATIKAQGRSHFREAVMVLGRRAGKNWMGAIVAAYQAWRLLCTGDPQAHLGVDAATTLTLSVFAGQHDQALRGQRQNIVDRILQAPCFQPFVAEHKTGVLRLYTPAQLERGAREAGEEGLIEIVARESTVHSARSPSTFALFFDEIAFAVNSGANRGADELFPAAVPSLQRSVPGEIIYQSSSPSSRHGALYTNYLRGLALDDGQAVRPGTIVFQLPSWDLSEDFELTQDGLEAYPGGPDLPRIDHPGVTYEQVLADFGDDPDMMKVEFWAQWRDSPAAYLPPEIVDAAFASWNGHVVTQRLTGSPSVEYVVHLDGSKSLANTALIVAHLEDDHYVADVVRVWEPKDFPDHTIDYEVIIAELENILRNFPVRLLTTDQFLSVVLVPRLQRFVVANKHLPRRTDVREQTATGPLNRKQAELTKTRMSEGRVHLPDHELARRELLALEDRNGKVAHPTAGPTQTDDICDALFNTVWNLMGKADVGVLFSGASLRASQQGGLADQFSRVGTYHRRFPPGARRGGHGGPARGRP